MFKTTIVLIAVLSIVQYAASQSQSQNLTIGDYNCGLTCTVDPVKPQTAFQCNLNCKVPITVLSTPGQTCNDRSLVCDTSLGLACVSGKCDCNSNSILVGGKCLTCPAGFSKNPNNPSACYLLAKQSANKAASSAFCKSKNADADLPAVSTAQEFAAAVDISKTNNFASFWTNAVPLASCVYTSNNVRVDASRYGTNNPDNSGATGGCAGSLSENALELARDGVKGVPLLNDRVDSGVQDTVVCQYSGPAAPPCPSNNYLKNGQCTPCPAGFESNAFNPAACYLFLKQSGNKADSSNVCKSKNPSAGIPSISTVAEFQAVSDLSKRNGWVNFWTNSVPVRACKYTSNGVSVDTTSRYCPNNPDNGGQGCSSSTLSENAIELTSSNNFSCLNDRADSGVASSIVCQYA